MASKTINIPEIGEVIVTKRRNTRSLRLKIAADGAVHVSMPTYLPYIAATTYIKSHTTWIAAEKDKRTHYLYEGQKIGRLHTLRFIYDETATTPKARVASSEVVIRHVKDISDSAVQHAAKKAALRALKLQARHFLPKRLYDTALREGYTYNQVSVKQLKSRWGSCNQNKDIVLNIFLMELPVELIDYVILHELAHTRYLHHGKEFWNEMNEHTDNKARQLRKEMKAYQPSIPAKSVT